MEVAELRQVVLDATRLHDDSWLAQLEPRKLAELQFHDRDRAHVQTGAPMPADEMHANRKYYSVTRTSTTYVHDWVAANVPGKVFLDYACGNGDRAIEAARRGATLAIGIDISPVSIRNAHQLAREAGVEDRTVFVQADCERTELPEASVDVMLCSGMLHHLDLGYALPEMRRIMKPGGRCLAVEALAHNPLIRLYRRFTPQMRTEWETKHILSLKDLHAIRYFFDIENVRFWHLATLCATPLRRLRVFPAALSKLETVDAVLLRTPGIRRWAWMFTFEMVRRRGDRIGEP